MACENLDQKLLFDNSTSGAMMILRVMAESVMQAQNIGNSSKDNSVLKPSYPHSILSLINEKSDSSIPNLTPSPLINGNKPLGSNAHIFQQVVQSVNVETLTKLNNTDASCIGTVNSEQIFILNLSDLHTPFTIDNIVTESLPNIQPNLNISKVSSNTSIINFNSNEIIPLKLLQNASIVNANCDKNTTLINNMLPFNSFTVSTSSFVPASDTNILLRTPDSDNVNKSYDESLPQKTDLISASSTENSLRPYKCDMCNATFTRLGNFTRHKMVHTILLTEDSRHKCDTCGRHFLRRCDLKRHLSIHEGTEPFRCSICNKGYIRNSDLVTHLRFHNKEKPFKCDQCNKGFSQKGDLMRHVRGVHHLLDKPLTCGHCTKKFAKEATLIRHFQNDHKDIILKSLSLLNENKIGKDSEENTSYH